MNEITVSAQTVNDAIREASIELGVVSTELEYDVIEKGSAGFLGIGKKQAVIRAWKKVEEPVKKAEPKKEAPRKEKPEVKKQETVKETKKEEKKETVQNIEKPVSKAPVEEKKEEVPEKKVVEITEETKVACETFLADVLRTIGLDASLTSTVDEDGALCINIEGDHMGLLIGKHGQTLDSLQYLTNRVANKMQDGYVRVKLDTENYRQRRKDTLENLAKNIAHKVKRTRKAVSLEPMNPYERRIIHSALQGDKYVSTHSEGEEPYRRVVVTLARK